jgi:HlyD family secretion protein
MNTGRISSWYRIAIVALIFLTLVGCTASKSPAPGASSSSTKPTELPPVKVKNPPTLVDAQVIPVRNASLSFSTAGVVEEILVKEGQTVKKGDVLARLTGKERLQTAVSGATLAVATAQNNLKKLNDAAATAKSNADLTLAKAKIAVDDAQTAYDNRANKLSSNTLDGLRADYILAKQALDDAQTLYDGVKDRAEDDQIRAAALSALTKVRKNYDRALYNLNYGLGLPDPKETDKAQAALDLAKSQLSDAQRNFDKVKDGKPDPDDLALAQAQLQSSQDQLAAAKTAVNDLELKAPFDSTITTINVEVGEYVTPAVPAGVVGDLSHLQIQTTNLSELDVVGIAVGDPVSMTFDAIPGLELPGKVVQIQKQGQNIRGDIDFTVLIDPNSQDSRLLWSMTSAVKFTKN